MPAHLTRCVFANSGRRVRSIIFRWTRSLGTEFSNSWGRRRGPFGSVTKLLGRSKKWGARCVLRATSMTPRFVVSYLALHLSNVRALLTKIHSFPLPERQGPHPGHCRRLRGCQSGFASQPENFQLAACRRSHTCRRSSPHI